MATIILTVDVDVDATAPELDAAAAVALEEALRALSRFLSSDGRYLGIGQHSFDAWVVRPPGAGAGDE